MHDNQKKIIAYYQANELNTLREVAKVLGVDPRTVQHHIKKLIEKGYMKKNSGMPGDYILTEKGKIYE